MQFPKFRLSVIATALAGAVLGTSLATSSALAGAEPTLTCASLGTVTIGPGSKGPVFSVSEGDRITVTVIGNGTASVVTNVLRERAPGPDSSKTYTATAADRTFSIGLPNDLGKSAVKFGQKDVRATDAAEPALTAKVTCTPAGTAAANTPDVISNIGANSQTDATGTGISNNTQSRLGGGRDNSASRNAVFFSSQNLPGAQSQFGLPDWNAWISAEGRTYRGGFEGSTADVVAGVDTLVSTDMLVGALLAYGRVDITNAGNRSEVTSLAIGAYFAKRFQNDLFLDGFISVARPEYQTQGTTFSANRVSAALTLTGSYTGGRVNVTPFGKLAGYRENQPAFVGTGGAVAANTITNVNLNLGAKVEPLTPLASGILPYISLSVDAASSTSTLNGTTSFIAPRIGVGFGAALGMGYLSVDLDAGKVRDNVRDMGLRATYEFTF